MQKVLAASFLVFLLMSCQHNCHFSPPFSGCAICSNLRTYLSVF